MPTPPRGIPLPPPGQEPPGDQVPGSDVPTPPEGFTSLADVIGAEDVGEAAPAVFGDPGAAGRAPGQSSPGQSPAGETAEDWPTLQYRSRERSGQQRRGMSGWLRPE
ncbi:hypothetical protein IQ251_07255 [Saccharopolyspora sp. HNM0983]|uniref:Uncharacterized protein n=1 Tax=Saccharopolyspora montiporae TaxID=2781240 RepID=A0A929FZY4_9PSEU|nr:hypothetical protein [Saccharopolyspora sp. HNM0983]